MRIKTTPHLNFRGQARAALEFYGSVFGVEVTLTTYGDVGMPKDLPDADKVVFGQVESAAGFRVMAYDVPGHTEPAADVGSTRRENGTTLTTQPFFVSVRAESFEEVEAYWKRLSEGSSVVAPLAATPWSAGFGMLTDRYQVTWSLDVAPAA